MAERAGPLEAGAALVNPLFTETRRPLATLALAHRCRSRASVSSLSKAALTAQTSRSSIEAPQPSPAKCSRAEAADIPIEQATRFDLLLNLATARALGVALPRIASCACGQARRVRRCYRCAPVPLRVDACHGLYRRRFEAAALRASPNICDEHPFLTS